MREVARQRCAPASVRLMDNWQFQMGMGSYFSNTDDVIFVTINRCDNETRRFIFYFFD